MTRRRQPRCDFALGTAGAGTGALTAGLKGGLGSASTVLDSGITIGALAAVNPTGSVTVGRSTPFLGRALRDRRRVRRARLSLADAAEDAQKILLKFRDKHVGGEHDHRRHRHRRRADQGRGKAAGDLRA